MPRHLVLVLTALLGAWLAGLLPQLDSMQALADVWRLRGMLIIGTGYLAIGCMAVAMILAARPVRLEKPLGGLDRMYRLHRHLGIAGTLFGAAHWLLEITPRTLVRQGWLDRPPRRGTGGADTAELFSALRDPAAELGEWAWYAVLALVIVALWRRVPYRHFARWHRLLPVAYLLLVFHSVVLMPATYWAAAPGLVAAPLMAGGVVAAVLSLAGRIGFQRRALGHVESVRLHDDRVLEVHCQLDTPWSGHQSGQFVFVTFDHHEGAHPFTVASAWRGDGHLVLAIKGLGDYTSNLPRALELGSAVTIEGPYGRFNFDGACERQVWVAGGIGITPFISRMEDLARRGTPHGPVDLFYSTDETDAALFALLHELAPKAGVGLHIVVPERDGLLTAERLWHGLAADAAQACVWFCGPSSFGTAMRKGLRRLGLPPGRFHQELFEMR